MAEQVIREYILKTDQFKAAIDGIVGGYKKVEKSAEDLEKEFQESFNKGSDGAKRFNEEVKKQPKTISELELRLVKLRELLRDDTKIGTEGFKRVSAEIKKTQTELDKLNGKVTNTNTGLKNTAQQAGNATGQFTSLTNSVKNLGIALGVAFGAQEIVRFVGNSIQAASGLNETITKTGELFGSSTREVVKWSEQSAQAFGQSQQQALNAASNFAIFGKSAGLSGDELVKFSTDFTMLASDLASFSDSTPEEAIQAIGAALRGESEPIRRYGVLLDEATLRQSAFEAGIISSTKQALTPQQKVLAAQIEIFKQTSAAQGDFARTSGGLANQQRILAGTFADVQVKLGQELLPTVLKSVKGINEGLQDLDFNEVFRELVNVFEPLGNIIKTSQDNFTTLFNAFGEGSTKTEKTVGILDALGTVLELVLLPTTLTIKAFNALVHWFADAYKEGGILTTVLDGIGSAIGTVYNGFKDLLGIGNEVETGQKGLAQSIKNSTAAIKDKTKATQDDNTEDAKKLTALQAISKELAAVTERIQTQILLNGFANQKEVERYTYLTAQLNRVKEGIQDINDRAKPITLDPVGIEESQMKLTDYAAAADEAVLASGEIAPAVLENIQQVGDTTEEVLQSAEQNALDVLSVIGNTVNQIGSLINQVYDQQQQAINDTLQTEINAINKSTLSEEAKQAKIDALQKKAAKEQYDLQVEAFKVNQALQIVNTVISTAQAVISGLAAGFQAGGPAGIALGPATAAIAAALGAVQIGIIASQKPPAPPAFAKGTEFVQRGKNKPGIDTIPAYLNEGEAVIPTDKNKQYPGLAKAWIGGKLESYVNNVMLAPKIAEIERKAEERWMSKLLEVQGEKYDDMRLFMATTEGNMYLRSIAKAVNSNTTKKRTIN